MPPQFQNLTGCVYIYVELSHSKGNGNSLNIQSKFYILTYKLPKRAKTSKNYQHKQQ